MSLTNPHVLWSQLARTALLGTPQSSTPIPDLLGSKLTEGLEPPEKQLLLAAGTLSLVRKAGYQPLTTTAVRGAAAPAETQPALGPTGSHHLRLLLSGSMGALLPKYLQQLAHSGRRLPFPLLVPVLEYARTHPELRRLVGPVLGQRGQWLAAQNPDWQTLLAAAPALADYTLWETGTLPQRILYLEGLRQQDPGKARELLTVVLTQEPAKNQAQLLQVLAVNLNPEDASLLEQQLASKSKEVRQAVLPLLVQLPGSAVVERLWQRAASLLTLKSTLLGRKLLVTLPEAWDKSWQADGIEQKDGRFTGEKAAWLGQLLSILPPARWAAHWGLTPTKVLELAASTDWAALLLSAWREAVLLHRPTDWAVAYLHQQLNHGKMPPLQGPQVAELLGLAQVSAVLLEHMPHRPRLSHPAEPWEDLLLSVPGPWPQALTAQALRTVENSLTWSGDTQHYAQHYRLLQLLQHLQSTIPPEQIATCTPVLTKLREVQPTLTSYIDQLLTTLHLRQQLADSLTEPAAPFS